MNVSLDRLEGRRLLADDATLLGAPQTVLADLNHDGKADEIAVVHRNVPASASNAPQPIVSIRLSLGAGNGVFKPTDVATINFNTAVAVTAGDVNGDGNVDVSVAGINPLSTQPAAGGAWVTTLLGAGDGRFKRAATAGSANPGGVLSHTTVLPQIAVIRGVAVADLDGSGLGDVAVLGTLKPGSNSVTANAASGFVVAWDPTLATFAPVAPSVITFPALTSVDRVFVGDLDGEGRADLVAARSTPLPPSMLAVVRPDLVVAKFSESRVASVRAGVNPLYLSASPSPTPSNRGPTTFGLGDADNDGAPDLVGTAGASTIRYSSFQRTNAGGASNTASDFFTAARTARSLNLPAAAVLRNPKLADVTGDGLADILADSQLGRLLGTNVTATLPTASIPVATFVWSRVSNALPPSTIFASDTFASERTIDDHDLAPGSDRRPTASILA